MALVFLYDQHLTDISEKSIKLLQEKLITKFILLQAGHEPQDTYDSIQAICSELTNLAMQIKDKTLKASEKSEVKN